MCPHTPPSHRLPASDRGAAMSAKMFDGVRRAQFDQTRQPVNSAFRYIVTTAAPPSPRLCCSAAFVPGTCRFSA